MKHARPEYMLLTPKVYHVTLNVRDPINFAANKEAEALHALRAEYQGRCFGGAFVCRVDALLEAGPVKVSMRNTSGEASVDVSFRATVAVAARGDILAGAVLLSDSAQLTLCSWEGEAPPGGAAPRASVSCCDAGGARAALQKGWSVALRLLLVQHDPFQTHIVAAGVLLVCEARPPSYRLAGSLDAEAAEALAPTAAAIAAELGRRAARPAAAVEAVAGFEAALRAPAPAQALARAELVDLVEIVAAAARGEKPIVAGVWGRPPGSDPFAPAATRSEDEIPGCSPPVDTPAAAAIGEMAREILALLVAARDMGARWSAPGAPSAAARNSVVAAMRAAQPRAANGAL